MKTMTVTEFKAHALRAITDVADSQEPVVLTKRGEPIAEVVPYRVPTAEAIPGQLAHMLAWEKDIVSPLGADIWDAAR